MNSVNKREPKTEPWGTSEEVASQPEHLPPFINYSLGSTRKVRVNLRKYNIRKP